MSADFIPSLHSYNHQGALRYWVQKVLPLVYDDSLSYYELLNKVVSYLNEVIETSNDLVDDVVALRDAFAELQTYVNDYFDNLDVTAEVESAIDNLVENGTIPRLISNIINDYMANEGETIINAWLDDHPEATTTVQDGSITNAKLVQSGGILSDVEALNAILNAFSAPNLLYDNESYPDNFYVEDRFILDPALPRWVINLPLHDGWGDFLELPEPFAGGFYIFDTMVSKRTGNNVTGADVTAKLKQVHWSGQTLVADMTIDAEDISPYAPLSYHWDGDEYREHWSWVFDIPSSSNWTGSMNQWVVELTFTNVVGDDAIDQLYIDFHSPWLVSYSGVNLGYALNYVHENHADVMNISGTIEQIKQDIKALEDDIATLELDVMPTATPADIAGIIDNIE